MRSLPEMITSDVAFGPTSTRQAIRPALVTVTVSRGFVLRSYDRESALTDTRTAFLAHAAGVGRAGLVGLRAVGVALAYGAGVVGSNEAGKVGGGALRVVAPGAAALLLVGSFGPGSPPHARPASHTRPMRRRRATARRRQYTRGACGPTGSNQLLISSSDATAPWSGVRAATPVDDRRDDRNASRWSDHRPCRPRLVRRERV